MYETIETITLDEYPDVRARIVYDSEPHAPENDGGIPTFGIYHGSYGPRLDGQVYGTTAPAWLEDALDRFLSDHGWTDGVEVFARYLRIWHGGDADVIRSGDSRNYSYVAAYTRELVVNEWGCEPERLPLDIMAESAEWLAYLDGDVYGIIVEERVKQAANGLDDDDEDEWAETDERCWGFYGDVASYVTDEARDMIESYAS